MSALTYARLAEAMSTTFSPEQGAVYQLEMDRQQVLLERYLNRVVERRPFLQESHPINGWVNLQGPVVSVQQVVDSEGNPVSWSRTIGSFGTGSTLAQNLDRMDSIYVPAWDIELGMVQVNYTAGDLMIDEGFIFVLQQMMIRRISQGQKVASGALSYLTVEGTTMGFKTSGGPAQVGAFTQDELSSLSHLRRRVMR
jgi:hypothetical protein